MLSFVFIFSHERSLETTLSRAPSLSLAGSVELLARPNAHTQMAAAMLAATEEDRQRRKNITNNNNNNNCSGIQSKRRFSHRHCEWKGNGNGICESLSLGQESQDTAIAGNSRQMGNLRKQRKQTHMLRIIPLIFPLVSFHFTSQ